MFDLAALTEGTAARRPFRSRLLAAALGLVLPFAALAEEVRDPHAQFYPAPLRAAMAAAASGAPEIVGGSNVSSTLFRNNFRWMVSVQFNGSGHFCGGSMIRPRYVLTAAHCLEGVRASQISVLQGSRQLSSGGTLTQVAGFVVHPNYDRVTSDNDIALLYLAEPISSPRVTPATEAVTTALAAPGAEATIIGWGRTSEGGQIPDILQRAQVPFISLATCASNYSGIFTITARMICAGLAAGGRDTCQGDSGGPIAVQDDAGVWQQIGITSFGLGCARPNRPGVYARVASFTNYISQVTQRLGAACYDPTWPAHFRRPEQFDCYTLLGFLDHTIGPIAIGFPIRMGGTRYTELHINNNGNVTFGSGFTAFQPVPLDQVNLPIIAPFWDDHDTRTRGMIRYGRATIDGQRAFMVIWQDVPGWNLAPAQGNTYQLVLKEPDPNRRWVDIEFNYSRVRWNRNGAYVGFSAGPDGPSRTRAGSGIVTSFLDTAPNALRSISNVGVPGRLSWQLRAGTTVR